MTTPNHYLFPNGRQPIEIARYLSSNGGQVVQYVARATRVDKENVKHEDARSDIRKAIHFLVDEYERVGGNTDDLKDLLPTEPRDVLLPLECAFVSGSYTFGEEARYHLNDAFFTIPDPKGLTQEEIEKINDFVIKGSRRAYLTF